MMRDHRGHRATPRAFSERFLRGRPPSPFAKAANRKHTIASAVALLIIVGSSFALYFTIILSARHAASGADQLAANGRHAASGWFVGILFVLAIVAVICVAIGVPLITHFRLIARAHANRVAAYGRCAACGYEIMGLTPEPDGCTVCPECGGAWRVNAKAPDA